MSRFLPQFPLQLVVFPGEKLNLHIFEPRYRQLISDANEGQITFGIPASIEGSVMEIGTEMRLTRIERLYDDGKSDIKTEAIGVYRILEFYEQAHGKLYSGADVEEINALGDGAYARNLEILESVRKLYLIMKIEKELPAAEETFLTYQLAHLVGMSIEEEYALLSLPKESDRQNYMLEHLHQLIPRVYEMESLRNKVKQNGHFKDFRASDFDLR